MTESPTSLHEILQRITEKNVEVDVLTKQLHSMMRSEIEQSKLHSKRVMKQGMEDFFSAQTTNPYPPASEEAELWQFGFNISKDNWTDNKPKG